MRIEKKILYASNPLSGLDNLMKRSFIMTIEEKYQLTFLDLLMNNQEENSSGHIIYKKKTHKNRYLNTKSH